MAKPETTKRDRVAQLEDELRQRDARVRELRADLDKAEALIGKLREHGSRALAPLTRKAGMIHYMHAASTPHKAHRPRCRLSAWDS